MNNTRKIPVGNQVHDLSMLSLSFKFLFSYVYILETLPFIKKHFLPLLKHSVGKGFTQTNAAIHKLLVFLKLKRENLTTRIISRI